jgi:asparagine synthetase B (glutamine-hydrolysing)
MTKRLFTYQVRKPSSSPRELLADSVRIHLRSDVPLGLFLSGGVDSATTLALVSQEAQGRVKTYTVGYDVDTPDNELIQARQIARHFGSDHHELVIDADDWWDGFESTLFPRQAKRQLLGHRHMLLAEETARHVRSC